VAPALAEGALAEEAPLTGCLCLMAAYTSRLMWFPNKVPRRPFRGRSLLPSDRQVSRPLEGSFVTKGLEIPAGIGARLSISGSASLSRLP
jgi:hypothetical protein